MTTLPQIDNKTARALFLDHHGLAKTPSGSGRGADLQQMIDDLGFVQIDSINTVARAHHMILHVRCPSYRPRSLARLHDHHRGAFEHWTHDASMISMPFFPHWKLKFRRHEARLAERWQKRRQDGFEDKFETVLQRISSDGPCSSSDVGEDEGRSSGGWWDWRPSKIALEYLWRTGELSVTRRDGFRKVYDLTERVIPRQYLGITPTEEETVDWACRSALDRLGFATSGELAAFWDLITPLEAKNWCGQTYSRGEIIEANIGQADGSLRKSFMWPGTLDAAPVRPTSRLRILSPFDPALRDRKRAERMFGFFYRIEIFVPEHKRRYGYYVFPILEGDQLVGRIDMKADRDRDCLAISALWAEKNVRFGAGRLTKLDAALARTAGLAGVSQVIFENGWLRSDF
ncbi:winged helix-turn-helix domain-containing protein [Actibacterium sp. 188UL27-1]|uniref:winged helix-turn-helix domain-containing protein n=1 Tax=Actibacterium sp. 188UL27-1 TaxID=2786961 RepID=UPI00195BFA6E|nr:crosslink repair DNA glycosylase YcaQ family protein [Actibacterium sp. 188UL27-1]MBM7067286.1 YcaQ family DNA glycosylase [Actibacterium sp. 188UL27-1]